MFCGSFKQINDDDDDNSQINIPQRHTAYDIDKLMHRTYQQTHLSSQFNAVSELLR